MQATRTKTKTPKTPTPRFTVGQRVRFRSSPTETAPSDCVYFIQNVTLCDFAYFYDLSVPLGSPDFTHWEAVSESRLTARIGGSRPGSGRLPTGIETKRVSIPVDVDVDELLSLNEDLLGLIDLWEGRYEVGSVRCAVAVTLADELRSYLLKK